MSRTSSLAKVMVVAYDQSWPDLFDVEANRLCKTLGQPRAALEHIGSTSVPGLWAKPIIDMLLTVPEISALDADADRLRSLGYEVMGEYGIRGRRYYRRDDEQGIRRYQVHAFSEGSEAARRHLMFRDYLRATPERAGDYAALKQQLADAHPDDIHAYVEGKDALIKTLIAEADHWSRDT